MAPNPGQVGISTCGREVTKISFELLIVILSKKDNFLNRLSKKLNISARAPRARSHPYRNVINLSYGRCIQRYMHAEGFHG